jgi:GNAT superfamily N-acetyltransferase
MTYTGACPGSLPDDRHEQEENMIQELDQQEISKVRPLFRPLEHLLFCRAVLEGSHPGRVFVDDPVSPQTAFLITREVWSYLAGEPDNAAFNRALNRAIFRREIVGEGVPLLQITCHPRAWERQIGVVCHPRQPVAETRRHYVGRNLQYDWRASVPDGFAVHPISRALLARPGLSLPDDVKNLIEGEDPSAGPLGNGFGYVLLHEDAASGSPQVASYALVDCIAGTADSKARAGDIFLFTADEYRRRGLATIASAATVEHGLAHGLAWIAWDCAEHNLGSRRTAERLGFELAREYTMYYFLFDQASHVLNEAWNSLEAGRYREAAGFCDQILTLAGEPPPHAAYLAARAWAGLGDRDRALAHLRTAADQGWASADSTRRAQEFEGLRDTPEWAAVLERIEQNQQEQDTG